MEVTPIERTVVEYSLTLSAADADLAVKDPFSFGEKMRDYLLPHMPQGGVSPRKPGAASQITISKNGHGRKGAKKAKAPKAPKGAGLLKAICPECGKQVAAKFLPLHRTRKHATASAATSSSTE